MEILTKQAKHLGYLFYVASPNETTFYSTEEIPNYVNNVVPHFLSLMILEMLILRWRQHNPVKVRWNDLITSAGHGIVYTITSAMTRGVELVGYQWLYERRVLDLDWRSPVIWWLAALGVDLGYYWTHRFVHEVSVGWAAHQVHHSSEEYNLSTALRQSVFQKFFAFGFYLPLAWLGVPLPALLVHLQFNLLYQFWIHTEVVSTLGPLEWVFNTPSHHRVHHGSNPWCLDKNYAGVLIIWDRLFGTFEAERDNDQITYGLVDQPQTFNVPYLQLYYYRDVIKSATEQDSWSNTVRSLLNGPGWTPGSPRLGHPWPDTDKPTPARKKYNPEVSRPLEVYLVAHFFVALIIQQTLMLNFHTYSWLTALLFMMYLLVSLGNIGAMYDGWAGSAVLEAVRCAAILLYSAHWPVIRENETLNTLVVAYSAASMIGWTLYAIINLHNFNAVSRSNGKKKVR